MSLTGFISYKRVGWTGQTPWNPTNLNIMDKGIKDNNDMIANLRSEVSALNSNIDINVHNIELSPENNNNNSITITLPRYNFLLIEYGNKNGGQSYGGNTTVICGKTNTDKPCFVPVYLNNELLGIIYMCYNVSKSIFRAHIVNNPKNSTYLIRIIGIGNKN